MEKATIKFNPTKFEDLVIDGARVENVNRVGISVACNDVGYLYNECSAQYPEDLIENFSSTDVVVRNCYIKNAGGDSIIAYHLKGGLFEYSPYLILTRLRELQDSTVRPCGPGDVSTRSTSIMRLLILCTMETHRRGTATVPPTHYSSIIIHMETWAAV